MRTVKILFRVLMAVVPVWQAIGLESGTLSVPVDGDPSWTIGIAQFRKQNVSDANAYLAASFPLRIRERITGLTTHRFSDEEMLIHRKAIINREIKKQVDNLLQLQRKRDEELFNESKEYQKKKINEDFIKNSGLIKERIGFLRGLEPDKVNFEREKGIELKDENGQLFGPPPFSALRYTGEIGVDILIWGSLEEIQGYLYCEISVFDRVREESIFQMREAGSPNELYQSIESAIPAMIAVLLGHEWATLLVDVDPAFSFIEIDGELKGMGTAETAYREPGEVTVTIHSPGYESKKTVVTLEPRERKVLELALDKKNEAFILIETVPPSANVYLNSLWSGKTPLVIEKPQILTRMTLALDNFHDAYYRLGPESPSRVLIPLVKTSIDFDWFREVKRSRFFSSMAAFLLSLPIPIFSFGLARDYFIADKLNEYEFFSASYYWTFFISGALFVNMIIDLLRYVDSHNQPIG